MLLISLSLWKPIKLLENTKLISCRIRLKSYRIGNNTNEYIGRKYYKDVNIIEW